MKAGNETVIRGGTLVTVDGQRRADILSRNGQVVEVGRAIRTSQAAVIDASGMLILPGGVDMHVHLTPVERRTRARQWADDFASGSQAAAAGGITTVGNMSVPRPNERLQDGMQRLAAEAEATSGVDFVLHPVIVDPGNTDASDLRALAEQGYSSLKLFMSTPEFDGSAGRVLDLMELARELGLVTIFHCEDSAVIAHLRARASPSVPPSGIDYARTRPIDAEVAAVARAAAMCAATAAPTYLVHLSSEASLALVREARSAGHPIYAETRPIYLHFTEAVYQSAQSLLFVGSPPVRSASDQTALWSAISDGSIDTVCSDHAAWRRADKLDPMLGLDDLRPGLPELETLMPVLYSEGVATGRISLEQFVALTSTNAAQIFGLFPQKGTIAPGADADLVIWDPSATRIVRATDLHSRSDYTPYEGRSITGWPRQTIRRGKVIYEVGRHIEPGGGRRVRAQPNAGNMD